MSGTTCCISFNIMNDTTFSCSHFYSHSFLSAGMRSEMPKRSQESSSRGSPMMKAKACCLVSRQSVFVGQDYTSNPESPESTRDSQVWPWKERHEKSGWYSVQHASGNREKKFRRFWRSRRDARLGIPRVHAKSRSEHQRPTHTRWQHLGNIDELREIAHFDMDAINGFIPSYEKNLELFQNSEFENIKGLFGITRMMIEGNSEIQNVFPADVASSLWGKPVVA